MMSNQQADTNGQQHIQSKQYSNIQDEEAKQYMKGDVVYAIVEETRID